MLGLPAGLAEFLAKGTFDGDRFAELVLLGEDFAVEEGVDVLEEERDVGILPPKDGEPGILD